ncbi:hypothetical protein [Tichowtungia aerotolerans]|uniref:Uncharacterized protein n=1 Tax=Tichowtungia aerotolerans TaxID=2697043 RepID=A0A6P1MDN4_9BACT|nr:hypothetical protein [Tichowtungia aerotolerans]QHI70674.1 hypothetical protein GT409_14910 [Tichowtungia aerotolerans]
MNKYSVIRSILALFVFLTGFTVSCARSSDSVGHLDIINESGETLEFVKVNVCKKDFSFTNILVGATVSFDFPVSHESGYSIAVVTASGQKISSELGYVTRGFDFSDKIKILADKATIERVDVSD